MKKMNKKVSLCLAAAILFLQSLLFGVASAAGTASMYLSPASGSYTQGATLSVNVYEDSGSDMVNAVQANLSYNASLLTFSSISSSSAFGIVAESSGGGGSVRIGRGTVTPVSGAQVIATVIFSVSAPGTASIDFAGGSAVVRSSDNQSETLSTSGGSYTLSAPAAPAPTPTPTPAPGGTKPTPKPTTPSSSTPSQPSTPAAAVPTVLSISDISISGVTSNSITVKWKTSLDATSEVDYGLSAKYILSTADGTPVKDHSLTLSSAKLAPNTTYHYAVKSVDANGNQVASKDQTFSTSPAAQPAKPTKKNNSALIAFAVVVVLAGLGFAGLKLFPNLKALKNPFPSNLNNQTTQPGGSPNTSNSPKPAVIKPTSKPPSSPSA